MPRYTKTIPRKWSKHEEDCLKEHINNQITYSELLKKLNNRSKQSIYRKLTRFKLTLLQYNKNNVDEKIRTDKDFFDILNAKCYNINVLDAFSGNNKKYKLWGAKKVFTNDKNKKYETTFNKDSYKLLCQLNSKGDNQFDLVDIDPFGTCFDCWELAIRLAKCGVVITHGEIRQIIRFKRKDLCQRYFNKTSIEVPEDIIKFVKWLGFRHKKKITVYKFLNWNYQARGYYLIEPIKQTRFINQFE